jgi:glutamyl-tRNA reductase
MQMAQQHIQQQDAVIQELNQKLEEAAGDKAQADVISEARKNAVAEYKAETERYKETMQSMTPEQVQAIVMRTFNDLLTQGQGAA